MNARTNDDEESKPREYHAEIEGTEWFGLRAGFDDDTREWIRMESDATMEPEP
jgi:hypothetical protein